MCSGLIFYIISRGLITKDIPYLIRRFMQLTLITALFQCGVAITQYFTQHALGLKKLGEINELIVNNGYKVKEIERSISNEDKIVL
jgi:hypothetical protein